MICMSPYSMPLCTIFTKCPAPSGPTWVTHGPVSVFAEIASSTSLIRSQAASDPPGMIEGPNRAPSSPPDTPHPTKFSPFSRSAASRRRVSPNRELPPSIRMSPASSSGASCASISSTGFPAVTIIMMRRGRSSAATSSSSVRAPVNFAPACSRTNASIQSVSRFQTTVGKPCSSMFSARLRPIVPSPIIANVALMPVSPVRTRAPARTPCRASAHPVLRRSATPACPRRAGRRASSCQVRRPRPRGSCALP